MTKSKNLYIVLKYFLAGDQIKNLGLASKPIIAQIKILVFIRSNIRPYIF